MERAAELTRKGVSPPEIWRQPLPQFSTIPPLPTEGCMFQSDYMGPTEESNWVILGRILVGAYPSSQDDELNTQILTSILQLGIGTFVCLQKEYQHHNVQEWEWREGRKLRPYIYDAVELIDELNFWPPGQKPGGLEFVHLPIVDCATTSDTKVLQLCKDLCKRLASGENMYIHCWGGHGRTGTVVSIMLGIIYGISAEEAMRRVQLTHDLREYPIGVPSPQTEEQRQQVRRILKGVEHRRRKAAEAQAMEQRRKQRTEPHMSAAAEAAAINRQGPSPSPYALRQPGLPQTRRMSNGAGARPRSQSRGRANSRHSVSDRSNRSHSHNPASRRSSAEPQSMPQAPQPAAPAVSGRAANATPKLSITNGLSGAAAVQDPVIGGDSAAGGMYAAAAARRRSSAAHSTATATSAASDKQSFASAHSTPAAVPQSSAEVGLVCGSVTEVPTSAAAPSQDTPTVARPDAYSTPDAAVGAPPGPTPTTPSAPLSPSQPRNRPSSRNPNFRGHRHLRKKSAVGGRNGCASGHGASMDSNGIQAIYGAGAAPDRGQSHDPSPKRRPASVSASRRRRTRSHVRSHSRSQSSASHTPLDTPVDDSSPSGARLLAHAEGEWQDSLRGGPMSPGSESRTSQRSRTRPVSSSQRHRRGFSQNPTYSAPRQGRGNTRPHSRGSSADPSARRPSSSAAARVSARDRVARRQRAMMEYQRERHQIGLVMDPRDEATAQRSGHRPRTPVSVSDLPNSGGLTTGALGDQLRAAHAAVRRPDMQQQQRQMRNSPAKRVHQVPNRPSGSAHGRRLAGVPAGSPQGVRGSRGRPLGFMHGRRLRTAAPAVQEAKQAAGRGGHARPPASSVDDVLSVDELPDYPDFEKQLEALNAAAIADQAAGSGANAVRATLRHSADLALGSGGVEGGKQDGVSIVGLLQPNAVANPTVTATGTSGPTPVTTTAGGPVVRSAAGIRSLKPPSVVEDSSDTHQTTTVPQQQHKAVVRSAAGIRSLKPPAVVEDALASRQTTHTVPHAEHAPPVGVTGISEQEADYEPSAPAQSVASEPTGAPQPAPASAAPLAVVPETAVAVQPAPASTVPVAASAADTIDCPHTPPTAHGQGTSAGIVHASDALEVTIDDLQRMPSDSSPTHLPPTRSGSEDAEDESGAYTSASSTSAGSRSTRRSGVEATSPMGQGMGGHDSDRDVLHTPERPDSDKTDVAVATSPAVTTASGMPAAVAVTTAASTDKSTGDCDKPSAKTSALQRPEGDSIVIVHSTRDRGSKADEVMHATPVQSAVPIAGTVHSLPMHAH